MWRREKGWSQGDLAKRLKVRAIQVSRWERKTSRPTIDRVFALARLFQVEPGEVLQATRK